MLIPFLDVRRNYKTSSMLTHQCELHLPNTCAIRLSEALVAARSELLAKFKSSGKNVCPHGYVRGAQDLAAVLARGDVLGIRHQGFEKPEEMPASLKGQRGIICFMNIPGFSGQGHIDLWDVSTTASPSSEYWDASPLWFWRLP
jgi:hypothetical protein